MCVEFDSPINPPSAGHTHPLSLSLSLSLSQKCNPTRLPRNAGQLRHDAEWFLVPRCAEFEEESVERRDAFEHREFSAGLIFFRLPEQILKSLFVGDFQRELCTELVIVDPSELTQCFMDVLRPNSNSRVRAE